jgi:PadR family transcriptional regulator AphA
VRATTSKLTPLEYVLLGLLQQPMHAYEMWQRFAPTAPLGLIWHLKQSHLYALLARLEALGFASATVETVGARPPRRVLRLTAAGRLALDGWLATPVNHGRDIRQEFLAKLYFAAQRDPADARRLIAAQEAATRAWYADVQGQMADAAPFARLVLDYRLGQISATLTWLAACAATLTESPANLP